MHILFEKINSRSPVDGSTSEYRQRQSPREIIENGATTVEHRRHYDKRELADCNEAANGLTPANGVKAAMGR
jgi:hypothetical protein